MPNYRSLLRAGAALALGAPIAAACTTFDDVTPPSSSASSSTSSSSGEVTYPPDPGMALTTNDIRGYIKELGGTKFLDDPTQGAVANTVLKSCQQFKPNELSLAQCAMVLVIAMSKASDFDPQRRNATTTSDVPSVGLLQNRWDVAAAELYVYGDPANLKNAGCDLKDYTFFSGIAKSLADEDPTAWRNIYMPNQAAIDKLLESASCSVAIGAWHIFLHAIGGPGEGACNNAKTICSASTPQQGTLAGGMLGHAFGGKGCLADTTKLVDTVQASFDRLRQHFGANPLDLRTQSIALTENRAKYCSGEALKSGGLCTNVPPSGEFSCADQSLWGKCDVGFGMEPICNLSCGRCGTACTDISKVPPNTPTPEEPNYYCTTLAMTGKCPEANSVYCHASCGRCPKGP